MVDHLALAKAYRNRAAGCETASKNTSSMEFADCYRQLSRLYANCAKLQEDFFERSHMSVPEQPIYAVAGEAAKPRLGVVTSADTRRLPNSRPFAAALRRLSSHH
jgi:hypothetical protein